MFRNNNVSLHPAMSSCVASGLCPGRLGQVASFAETSGAEPGRYVRLRASLALGALIASSCAAPAVAQQKQDILRTPETDAALKYRFSADDEKLLDEVEGAAFEYFDREIGKPAQLAKDRKLGPVASVAAVGFQLAGLPIGVERDWIKKDAAQKRATTILKSLIERTDNKKWGMYQHFVDLDTAGPNKHGYDPEVSTVDTALLIAGAIVAGEYFEGEVRTLVDRMVADADWKTFAIAPKGFVTMAWKPEKDGKLDGPGKFMEHHWWIASDEERLLYLIAIGSPNAGHALEPKLYYQLERRVKQHADMPPFVVSYPGNLFTYLWTHCYIDARKMQADDPAQFGIDAARVDWLENSRRATLTHRRRCIEAADRFKTFAADRWGLSACAAKEGYIVPDTMPNFSDKDQWCNGTVAPYAAACSILFAPEESLAAMRAFRNLKSPRVWTPISEGGYGFPDSFNIEQRYAPADVVGIGHGPRLVAIENARSGLVWRLFMKSQTARNAMERLKLK